MARTAIPRVRVQGRRAEETSGCLVVVLILWVPRVAVSPTGDSPRCQVAADTAVWARRRAGRGVTPARGARQGRPPPPCSAALRPAVRVPRECHARALGTAASRRRGPSPGPAALAGDAGGTGEQGPACQTLPGAVETGEGSELGGGRGKGLPEEGVAWPTQQVATAAGTFWPGPAGSPGTGGFQHLRCVKTAACGRESLSGPHGRREQHRHDRPRPWGRHGTVGNAGCRGPSGLGVVVLPQLLGRSMAGVCVHQEQTRRRLSCERPRCPAGLLARAYW